MIYYTKYSQRTIENIIRVSVEYVFTKNYHALYMEIQIYALTYMFQKKSTVMVETTAMVCNSTEMMFTYRVYIGSKKLGGCIRVSNYIALRSMYKEDNYEQFVPSMLVFDEN